MIGSIHGKNEFSSPGIFHRNTMQDLNRYSNLTEAEFRKELDAYAEAYHNAQSLISDADFDRLIRLFEDRFGPYSEVGAEPRGEKVPLPYYLGSLRKVKDSNELANWMKNYSGPYVIQDKVDGLTLLYVISNGTYQLYTRGRGTEGLNVSHMIDYLRLPKLPYNVAVRGEVVMYKETFNKIGAGFANARNMVSGLVNSKESFAPAVASQLHFLAFRVMDSDQTPETQILQLRAVGFETPYAISTPSITIEQLDALIPERRKEAPYEMDGLVIYQNRAEEYPENENPRHVVAYKGLSETAVTTVMRVEWEASMHRLLKPVVVYNPVQLSGASLERASGFNARFIGENGIGPDAIIRITRSGDTIPYITEVIQKAAPGYPDPAVHGQYHYNGVDIVLNEDNNEVKAAKMEHFLNKLDITGFGEGRVRLLVDSGIATTSDLLQATPDRFLQIPGLGTTLAYQLYNELRTKTLNVPLAKLMAASTVFPNFGEKRARTIVAAIPNVLQRAEDPRLASDIQAIGGFNTLAYDFVNNLPKFVAWLKLHPSITVQEQIRISSNAQSLQGLTVVFSGFRDKNLEDAITQRGGRVTSAVSKKTSMVVMKDIQDRKGKAEQALTLGIPLISKAEFELRYL